MLKTDRFQRIALVLYARGASTRVVAKKLRRCYGADAPSHEMVSQWANAAGIRRRKFESQALVTAHRKQREVYFCGCCGVNRVGEQALWCRDCRPHVDLHTSPWYATFFAQHGRECPISRRARP